MTLRHVAAGLLGAGVALASLAVHRMTWVGLPLGLLLAVAASIATGVRLRRSERPRPALSYAVGWIAVFTPAVLGRPEGDYVLASDLDGYAMMALSLAVLGVGVSALAADRGS